MMLDFCFRLHAWNVCAPRENSRVTIFDEQFRKVTLLMVVVFDDDLSVKSLAVENSLPMRDDGEGTLQIG